MPSEPSSASVYSRSEGSRTQGEAGGDSGGGGSGKGNVSSSSSSSAVEGSVRRPRAACACVGCLGRLSERNGECWRKDGVPNDGQRPVAAAGARADGDGCCSDANGGERELARKRLRTRTRANRTQTGGERRAILRGGKVESAGGKGRGWAEGETTRSGRPNRARAVSAGGEGFPRSERSTSRAIDGDASVRLDDELLLTRRLPLTPTRIQPTTMEASLTPTALRSQFAPPIPTLPSAHPDPLCPPPRAHPVACLPRPLRRDRHPARPAIRGQPIPSPAIPFRPPAC